MFGREAMSICVKTRKKYIITTESYVDKSYLSGKLMQKDLDMIFQRHGEIFSVLNSLRLHLATEFLLKM